MVKELLEALGVKKEIRILVFSVCITAVAMYFVGDRFLFSDRREILNQDKSEIENLKLINQKKEKQIEEDFAALQQRTQRINELSKEISRLQPYEQAIPEWRKALDDERQKSSQLQEQLNQLNSNSRELKQIVDSCTAERGDLKSNLSKLNAIISSYAPLVDRRNEIREIERNKDSVEAKIAELEGSPINRQFDVLKIEQLKRVSAEYQQQLLHLRQCGK